MSSELDQISVLRGHLEEIQEALQWSHGHFSALDLSENYRATKRTYSPSRITTTIGRALQRIEGYLTEEDETDEGKS
jgi:hypothetical protein